MNNAQRTRLEVAVAALSRLTNVEHLGTLTEELLTLTISDAQDIVTDVAEEEREKFDNMPPGLQGSEKGETLDSNASTLEDLDWPETRGFNPKEVAGHEDPGDALEELADNIQRVIDDIEGL